MHATLELVLSFVASDSLTCKELQHPELSEPDVLKQLPAGFGFERSKEHQYSWIPCLGFWVGGGLRRVGE